MADQKDQSFTKIEQLRPLAEGLNLTVKVVSVKTVVPKGRAMRMVECLVGDETGIIIFTARNDRVDLMKEGITITLQNAKVEVFKRSMRLSVERASDIKVLAEAAEFKVNENKNLSLIELERFEFNC